MLKALVIILPGFFCIQIRYISYIMALFVVVRKL